MTAKFVSSLGDDTITRARERATNARLEAGRLDHTFDGLRLDTARGWFLAPKPGWDNEPFEAWRGEPALVVATNS